MDEQSPSISELVRAIRARDLKLLQALIAAGADVLEKPPKEMYRYPKEYLELLK